VTLRDLNAKLIRQYRRDDTEGPIVGVSFDCPACVKPHRVYFSNDGRWTITGTTIDDLSISPSIDCTRSGCGFHRVITKGVLL
jgi:hypothetical protein